MQTEEQRELPQEAIQFAHELFNMVRVVASKFNKGVSITMSNGAPYRQEKVRMG